MAPHPPLIALDQLLEAERRLLMSGDLRAVVGLATKKLQLIEALRAQPAASVDETALAAMRASARWNQRLLASAISGVRAAGARIDAARRGGPALSTYDKGGQRQTIGPAQRRLEHKA